MQWVAADQSIQLSMNQTVQLVCLGAVAAFLNSELVAGKATSGSPLSVGQLSTAMAAANTTKAAEIAKQMAQSQKVCTIMLSSPKAVHQPLVPGLQISNLHWSLIHCNIRMSAPETLLTWHPHRMRSLDG